MEARQLLEEQGAFTIKDKEDLSQLLDNMISDKEFLKMSGLNAGNYVTKNLGASEKILSQINL